MFASPLSPMPWAPWSTWDTVQLFVIVFVLPILLAAYVLIRKRVRSRT